MNGVRDWKADAERSGSLCYEARLKPGEIGYLCAITEAHEGLAVIRTKDEALGIVEFWVSRSMREEFEDFLRGVKRELNITVGAAFDPGVSREPANGEISQEEDRGTEKDG